MENSKEGRSSLQQQRRQRTWCMTSCPTKLHCFLLPRVLRRAITRTRFSGKTAAHRLADCARMTYTRSHVTLPLPRQPSIKTTNCCTLDSFKGCARVLILCFNIVWLKPAPLGDATLSKLEDKNLFRANTSLYQDQPNGAKPGLQPAPCERFDSRYKAS